MTRPPAKKRTRPPQEISVRGVTYDKLKTYAVRNGSQVGVTLDAIITEFLDAKAKLS